MNQAYVRDPDITISDLMNELIAKIGENITVRRFVRFQLGANSPYGFGPEIQTYCPEIER